MAIAMRTRWPWIAVCAVLAAAAAIGVWYALKPQPAETTQSPQALYQNPVFRPVLADPSVIRGEDGYFYAYGTEDTWDDGTAHLVPIIRSRNLTEWEFVRDAFEVKPDWKDEGWLWAPDISFHEETGKYYLYYSYSTWGDPNPGIGVATADRPDGSFTDHGVLFTSESIGVANSIDPFYFRDDDGTPYLIWGSFHGIYGIELSADGLSTVGEKFQIADNQFEAPYIVKRGDYYYFFGSVGSCCEGAFSSYHVKIGRAESIRGPYTDRDGRDLREGGGTTILAANAVPDPEGRQFVGPGHNAVVTDDAGGDWIVYHAIDADDPTLITGATRRPMMIDPLIWEDGWPTVHLQGPGTAPQPGPVVREK